MYKFIISTFLLSTLACSSHHTKKAAEVQATVGTTPGADDDATILQKIQGTWAHAKDSLSIVEVHGNQWIFRYGRTDAVDANKYTIGISHALPRYVDKKVKADFVILTHTTDTMHYEIFGLTHEIMSLMYYPKMNIQVYNRVE